MYDTFIERSRTNTFGLFPHLIDVNTGDPIGGKIEFALFYICIDIVLNIDHVTWGGMGDSFYEVHIILISTTHGFRLITPFYDS